MKKHKLFQSIVLVFILFTTLPVISKSQSLTVQSSNDGTTFSKDTIAVISSFTSNRCDGKTYLEWEVKNLNNSGTFIIYRSLNRMDFQSIGVKKGIGVPISKEIAYYFVDVTEIEHAYYRLVYIANNKTYLASKLIDSNMHLHTSSR